MSVYFPDRLMRYLAHLPHNSILEDAAGYSGWMKLTIDDKSGLVQFGDGWVDLSFDGKTCRRHPLPKRSSGAKLAKAFAREITHRSEIAAEAQRQMQERTQREAVRKAAEATEKKRREDAVAATKATFDAIVTDLRIYPQDVHFFADEGRATVGGLRHRFTPEQARSLLEHLISIGCLHQMPIMRPASSPDGSGIVKLPVTSVDQEHLKNCASDCDGDCVHPLCPQNRDGEPTRSGRHCPIDRRAKEEL